MIMKNSKKLIGLDTIWERIENKLKTWVHIFITKLLNKNNIIMNFFLKFRHM